MSKPKAVQPRPVPVRNAPVTTTVARAGVERYHAKHGTWPTIDDLLRDNPTWDRQTTYNRLYQLRGGTADRRNVHRDHNTGRYYIEGVA